jgi:hypothetical protein
VVADLSGVDMTFAVFLLALCMYFVTTLTICSHDGGNDCRSPRWLSSGKVASRINRAQKSRALMS